MQQLIRTCKCYVTDAENECWKNYELEKSRKCKIVDTFLGVDIVWSYLIPLIHLQGKNPLTLHIGFHLIQSEWYLSDIWIWEKLLAATQQGNNTKKNFNGTPHTSRLGMRGGSMIAVIATPVTSCNCPQLDKLWCHMEEFRTVKTQKRLQYFKLTYCDIFNINREVSLIIW